MPGVERTGEVNDTARSRTFAAFYREQYGAVFGYAVRRIDDRETAREIALDVFRVAWAEFGDGRAPTRAWLLGVARNRIGDAYRRRERERVLLTTLEGEAALGTREGVPDERVRAALQRLPEAAREVLRLTYWDGLPAAQVGAVLGCSTAAVWVRLHRARQAFAAVWTAEEER